jgi:hypothetical protein
MSKGISEKHTKGAGKVKNFGSDNLPYPRLLVDENGRTELKIQDDGTRFGTNSEDLILSTIQQLSSVIGRGNDLADNEVRQQAFNGALASVVDSKPKDSIELMLATQMAAVHNIALEVSRRAMYHEQSVEGVKLNINCANKLMNTFARQVEALAKHRAKGQQKITVQHVNVNDGGQAIVGDVKQGGGSE